MPPPTRNGKTRTMKALADQAVEETEDEEATYRLVVNVTTVRESYKIDYNSITAQEYASILQTLNRLTDDPVRSHRAINLTGSDGQMHIFNLDHVVSMLPVLTVLS